MARVDLDIVGKQRGKISRYSRSFWDARGACNILYFTSPTRRSYWEMCVRAILNSKATKSAFVIQYLVHLTDFAENTFNRFPETLRIMSGPSKSSAGDTSFRKTWDRAEYTAKAEDRERKYKEEGAARAEAKSSGQKYRPRASTPPDAKETESRSARLDVSKNVGKISMVPAGAAVGKKGRGAGFYCENCDLTYKDNLQFVEHLNSRQHQVNIGESGKVKKATLEEVRDRLEWLARRKREEKEGVGIVVDLGERLVKRKEEEEKERAMKREKRNEKRRKTKDGSGIKVEDDEGYGGGIIA